MINAEYIVHGTASEKDAKGIEKEGFRAQEGRATVSADLAYAFDWATMHENRVGSKSQTELEDGEVGRIVLMKLPDGMKADYSTHSDIVIDDELKEISGYVKKFVSGARQLGIYAGEDPDQLRQEIEGHKTEQALKANELKDYLLQLGIDLEAVEGAKDKKANIISQLDGKGMPIEQQIAILEAAEKMDSALREEKHLAEREVLVGRENILMSIYPSAELGAALEELKENIVRMESLEPEEISRRIAEIILNDGITQISEGLDKDTVTEVISSLIKDTIRTEVVNKIRDLQIKTKRAQGFKLNGRDNEIPLELTERSASELDSVLTSILESVGKTFSTSDQELDEYIIKSAQEMKAELASHS